VRGQRVRTVGEVVAALLEVLDVLGLEVAEVEVVLITIFVFHCKEERSFESICREF
jgi:hypothetical protein